jgi:hypothetical protein
MIKKINKDKVKIKNLLGIIEDPVIEDLLFEIVFFLDKEDRLDKLFTTKEITLKTKIRISDTLQLDLNNLVDKGYIQQHSKTKFKLIKHLWE